MTTPAGWYPDPVSPAQQRYWDGTAWGPPAPSAPAPTAARVTIHYGFALLAVLALIGTLVPAIALFAGDDPGTSFDDYQTAWSVVWLLWGGMWTVVWAAFAIQHTLRRRTPPR